jgi:hypothetical protein
LFRASFLGEWIVYARDDGANYYLCLGLHDSGDDYLRSQIDAICCQEFPFLTALLSTIAAYRTTHPSAQVESPLPPRHSGEAQAGIHLSTALAG